MLRLARKVEDKEVLEESITGFVGTMVKAYDLGFFRKLKDLLKASDAEQKKIEFEQLFAYSFYYETDPRRAPALQNRMVYESINQLSIVFNQKALIAYTKDKYKLSVENLVKGILVRSSVLLHQHHLADLFTLYINLAYSLYKLEKHTDAITVLNKGLVIGEQINADWKIIDGFSKGCFESFKSLTFGLFFVKGNEIPELKSDDFDQLKVIEDL